MAQGGLGRRFDLEAARREAQEAKRAARIRSIVSNCVLVAVLLALAIGGKIGWDRWQDMRQREREEAEAARLAAEQAEAAKRKAEAEREKAAAEKREAERKAAAEKREAERKAREEAQRKEREAREAEKREREELRRRQEEHRVEQQKFKRFADEIVETQKFHPGDRIVCAFGLDRQIELSVDGERWADLADLVKRRKTIMFLDKLRDETVTNEFSEAWYPDGDTVKALLAKLNAERFMLVVRLKESLLDRNLALVALTAEKGLTEPEGVNAIESDGKVVGWTAPFAFGDRTPFFLLDKAAAEGFNRDWSARRRKLRAEAAKLDNGDQYVAERMEKALPDFARTIRFEIQNPPPEPKKSADKKSDQQKNRPLLKGGDSNIRTMKGGSNIRTMNGPQSRR